jgi:type III restriction enzyme
MGRELIPFIAQLEAITGAGKTPMLASIFNGLGPAIVFWTTKSALLVEQTAAKLDAIYRPLLPDGTRILSEVPSPQEWRALLQETEGTTIWVRTVASWNLGSGGGRDTEEARLNLHRPHPDWAGERSPWTQLGDRTARNRPLWVVYDESHGQTDVQLDQLLDLKPVGIFAASGTPILSEKMRRMQEALADDEVFGPIVKAAWVSVPTSEVAKAGLLKTTVRLADLDVDSDTARVGEVLARMERLDGAADTEGARIRPRALYIVEESNARQGDPRPVVLWKALVEGHGVTATSIAIATDTRELPDGAEKIASFDALQARHRHIIFNKKLEEGWDDPEAYIAYFDGETRSARRVKQLIGRVIRQPRAEHFGIEDLNSAHLFINTPNERFDAIVTALQRSLMQSHGTDEDGEANVKVVKDRQPQPAVALRAGIPSVSQPVWQLAAGLAVTRINERLESDGTRPFADSDLNAPGELRERAIDLTDEDADIGREARALGMNMRMTNRDFFLERVGASSLQARKAIPRRVVEGPMWEQQASAKSRAQATLKDLASWAVDEFVDHARYIRAVDPRRPEWTPKEWTPRGGGKVVFHRSLHESYTDRPSVLNGDEREMADALDQVGEGWWTRNFSAASQNGYGIPLPIAVGASNTFYPDFLWWIDEGCWAIETSGQFILEPKVHGKLVGLDLPRVALVVRGEVSADWRRLEGRTGWTLVRRSNVGAPRPETFASLAALLAALRE